MVSYRCHIIIQVGLNFEGHDVRKLPGLAHLHERAASSSCSTLAPWYIFIVIVVSTLRLAKRLSGEMAEMFLVDTTPGKCKITEKFCWQPFSTVLQPVADLVNVVLISHKQPEFRALGCLGVRDSNGIGTHA